MNLRKALKAQKILCGLKDIEAITEEIIDHIEVIVLQSGEEIYSENDYKKNRLYFVFNGMCRGLKNNNTVALLNAKECFGEFPMLDPSVSYHVSAQAYGESCFGIISEEVFEDLGKKHPKLWFNIARMLAERLRLQNDKFYSKPLNEIPRLFIGSSVKSLPVANALKKLLIREKLKPEIWNEKTFEKLGTSYLNRLEEALDKFDFGVFVFNNDDFIYSKGKKKNTTRDNVLFELGMFVGRLSARRAYVLWPENLDVKILSDFSGITVAEYKFEKSNLDTALKRAADRILASIEEENIAQQHI